MGQFIVKLGGKYLLWSTVVDAPVTRGGSVEELREYVQEWEGKRGLAELEQRLERVEQKGTSSYMHASAEEVVWLNRAGKGETCMTIPQLVEHYVTNGGQGELPVGLNHHSEWEARNG